MNQNFLGLAFQEATDGAPMWIIFAVVLVILFFIVVIVAVGLTIFLVMRKRSKAQKAAQSDLLPSGGPSASAYAGMSHPETSGAAPEAERASPMVESSSPGQESPAPGYESPASEYEDSAEPAYQAETALFDPSRTVAIIRENTVPITYGSIKFTSGVLAGQQFQVDPEGSYIGRESTLSQIVISDPRISKRHLWIGVQDGVVKIVDQDSRNGTFLNDPKSERIADALLKSGDTVIMGESDVARFEYLA